MQNVQNMLNMQKTYQTKLTKPNQTQPCCTTMTLECRSPSTSTPALTAWATWRTCSTQPRDHLDLKTPRSQDHHKKTSPPFKLPLCIPFLYSSLLFFYTPYSCLPFSNSTAPPSPPSLPSP